MDTEAISDDRNTCRWLLDKKNRRLGFRQNKLLEQTRGIITKSRLQAKQVAEADKRHHYERTFDAIMKMIHNEGLAGFY
ncbi:peroxisomal nicotinamide adenine dinucleotide carrier-like isoform X2 [Silene latifolia]|uniref:peroxisomal nicotinamide adenine dinucleotide carrier-like isoform X2 n=1 Tax=Silene latifolia TaxID=37657 RepID=UPI003D789B78